ncbi:hypothetical protein [Amycolatopsis solani]|uniref:hypothetical protein n=1 Tax=Amycolatopsis solani TaxID=3028615 RepID=UPI0025B0BC48|nr:hypothetical protein [Amycolatopsis sp. MEP2-6]
MVTEGPLTAAQIYEQLTGGKGVDSLGDAHDSADQLTNRMVERAQRISALRAKTMSGWQGAAGEAAGDATLPLVRAAADDAVHLKTAQSAVSAQMGSFGTAKNSVKPVAPQPPELTADDVINALNGEGWNSYDTKVTRWQADSQANIDAFSAYHSASTANGGRMPSQYAQLAESGAPVSLDDGTQHTTDKPGRKTSGPTDTGEWARKPAVPVQQDRRTGQDQRPDQIGGQTQDQVQQPGIAGGMHVDRPGTTTDQTHADSYVPQPVMPPAAQGGYEFGPTGQAVSNLGGNTGYNAGGYGTGGFGTGGAGNYSTGTGTGGTNQPGARNPAGGRGPGPGMGPGVGTGARLPEERLPGAPARGTAGPRGANGMPVGAPMGNGRGKEEDREKKKNPYLQNPDPDDTFGGFIEKPMPPVIGENRAKR